MRCQALFPSSSLTTPSGLPFSGHQGPTGMDVSWVKGVKKSCLSLQRRTVRGWKRASPSVWDCIAKNGPLGFTSFGGPAVHVQIFKVLFVEKHRWIEEATFEELFGLTQALSGPASTKMLYCINLHRSGTALAVFAFFLWSLPGAIAMYALSLGIANIGEVLPGPVYALLSGLNAAIVGVIALAAVQLSQRVITDRLTRALLFLSATAGLLYDALWYFPLLMSCAGLTTIVWDMRIPHRALLFVSTALHIDPLTRRIRGSSRTEQSGTSQSGQGSQVELESTLGYVNQSPLPTPAAAESGPQSVVDDDGENTDRLIPRERRMTSVSWKQGAAVISLFFIAFTVFMVLRGRLSPRPLLFSLFSNMLLAGTIIFGGGPVVIPLLRSYIVSEGWVSSRDFLLGLALIQAFPGPNFNIAVFLGSLTARNASLPSAVGAVLGFIGIFAPGMILVHGTMGIWSQIRQRPWVKSCLRGINAGAVGLIFTAVYRLWNIGYIDEQNSGGSSLSLEPWWLVIAATSYTGVQYFKLPIPVAALAGASMGLVWYGVTR